MKNVGIIAEYNPFHKGHLYQLEELRKLGAETITVCMNGNFVQRSEPAVIDKYKRAYCAIESGADLVIELPLRFGIASARDFAFGGIYILDKTGFIDTLAFGSEIGDISTIKRSVEYLKKAERSGLLKKYLDAGFSFASARDFALTEAGSPFVPRESNDILAFEYLKAIEDMSSSIVPVTIKRQGGYHDENTVFSASAIRKKIKDGLFGVSDVPKVTFDIVSDALSSGDIVSYEKFEISVLSFLKREALYRLTDPDSVYALPEGLGNRIFKYANTVKSLPELYEMVKTKRYTMSAVRRGILSVYFGLSKTLENPSYFHILAFNDKGRKLLKELKKSGFPVYHAFPSEDDVKFLPEMKTDILADNLYSLCKVKSESGGKSFYNTSLKI